MVFVAPRHGRVGDLDHATVDCSPKLTFPAKTPHVAYWNFSDSTRRLTEVRNAVCTENLSSGVVVVKSAQNGACTDHTGSLNRARNRRILVQGSMRSDAIVIVGVGFQDPTQMHLAQDDDVVQALAPD
jgi:hypothetical protein